MPPIPSAAPDEQTLVPFQVYNILDTLLEKEFDELCALASAICQTPVALINFIDQKKQYINSITPIPKESLPEQFVHVADTIAYADDLVIINNLTEGETNTDNGVVFYAGIPLVNVEGQTMGSLCVIDNEKRSLSNLQTTALKILAAQVMAKLELKRQDIELQKAYQALKDAHNFTKRFAAMAAHDIKNPLSSISLTAESLKMRLERINDEGCLKLVNMNISSIKKLDVLLDDMLAYSKDPTLLQKKKQLIKLPEFLLNIVSMIDVPENMTISYPHENFKLLTNLIALEQIFINLFTNAIRYNDKQQGSIQVRFKNDNDGCQLEIEDNGIGIAKEFHNSIFSDNFTLRVIDRYNKKGNGMGLSTVRDLVTALNGTIRLQSVPGVGTTFFISLNN